MVQAARTAEALGFESVWAWDHFHTTPKPADVICFESFTALTAIAALTSSIRLGHIVICSGFRNPALAAKMLSTMDVISGGRMEIGVGAGWKEQEWVAYGYDFPPAPERLATLKDQLEILSAMMRPGHATYAGPRARVTDAINVPKPIQEPRIPIMVGGNGPLVTWRLAARYADELNVDGLTPDKLAAALPVIHERCAEIGRDPASLRVSVQIWWELTRTSGQARVDLLGAYRDLGVSRVMTLIRAAAETDAALESFAEDVAAAGCDLGGAL
jgi:alkanesulfonate monooxygenase SsuD/methylene tetrahydromethanopterin reductase-like flavin-dependent oxidoreductase (luciferase family)